MLLLVQLRDESADPLLWNLYPKHHLFIHIVESAVTNPRDEWNYGDESEIGAAVELAGNTSSKHLCKALIGHYRDTFHL